MPEKRLYEYAIVRLVPRAEREEFINTGVILFCKKSGFLNCICKINETRLLSIDPNADIALIQKYIDAFTTIAAGGNCESPISKLAVPDRFRWLTATRSTILQCSKVHSGLTDNEAATLQQLFDNLVR